MPGMMETILNLGLNDESVEALAKRYSKDPAEDRKKLETAALHCPVHKSLHPDIQTPIAFSYA